MKTCSQQEFVEKYLQTSTPCIIDDFTHGWPAYRKWTRDYLLGKYGDLPIYYHHMKTGNHDLDWKRGVRETTLGDFLQRIESGAPIRHHGTAHPVYDSISVNAEILTDLHCEDVLKLLPNRRFLGLGVLNWKAWPWIPPHNPVMYMAAEGTCATGHYDPDRSHTFHCCFWGEKSVRLFEFNPAYNDLLHRNRLVDLSESAELERLPEEGDLPPLKGWLASVKSGQTLFQPTMLWHFYKYESTSLSYVIRARSFASLKGYSDFATDYASPLITIGVFSKLWRMVDWRRRGVVGNLLVFANKPVLALTRGVIHLINIWLKIRRTIKTGFTQSTGGG